MKSKLGRVLLLVAILSVGMGKLNAQTNPQFFNNTNATIANAFPLNSTTSNKIQWIFGPGQFRTAGLTGVVSPNGLITRLYIRMSATVNATNVYNNFTIALGQNRGTDSVWAAGASGTMPFDTTLTTCFFQPTHSLAGITASSWYGITLQNGFAYDPSKSLVVELKVSGGTGNGVANIATTGMNQRLYAAFSATTGTYNTGNANIGFDVVSLAPCTTPHAGNASSSSSNVCPSQNFSLTLINDSINAGLRYQWLVSTTGLSGAYSPMLNDTTRIIQKSQTNTHWYRCVVNCGTISDTSTAVNVITDSTQFAGTYTIDTSLASSATNYHSFRTLIANISCRGITAPVIINFAPHNTTFIESVQFGAIPGISSTNTITINGNGNTISNGVSPVVSFVGSRHIFIDSLNITNTGTTGFAAHIGSQSSFITIKKSKINAGTTSIATTNAAIVISGALGAAITAGNNGRFITIENNEIIGGYYGITCIGNTGYADNTNNIIRNNVIRDFYLYGIYMLHGDSNIIDGNDINRETRGNLSTFYGIYYGQSRNTKIRGNKIHSSGVATYTAYPIFITNCLNLAGFETEINNNLIYNINQTSGIFYGIYALTTNFSGFRFYHNTLDYRVPATSSSAIRGFFAAVAPSNVEFRNNIINIDGGGSGIKTALYFTAISTSFLSNHNVLRVASSSNNNIGFWGAANVSLANWNLASGQDSNSTTANPVFTTVTNLVPLSINIDNLGTPIASVPTDFVGTLRSLSTPDMGAFEFAGISGDLALAGAQLKRAGVCYGIADSVLLSVQNIIGSTVDFSIDPLTIVYTVNGPINTIDSIQVLSGSLGVGNSLSIKAANVNMSVPGIYTLSAFIRPNGVNNSRLNDSLRGVSVINVRPILAVSPKFTVVNSSNDTVILKAQSPIFPSGGVLFTEICHWRGATGAAPTAGWPAYLIADDYVELTGIPNSSLAGYTLEEWTGTSIQHTVTFSAGVVFSPTGTMILATGQLGASLPSMANFYYHTGNTITHSSTGDNRGYLIRNASGTIMDAVAFGTYIFPVASGVTSSDWTGATSNVSSAGIRLTGPDLNNPTNWVVESAAGRQDPNILNAGVSMPVPGSMAGFSWFHLGSPIDTMPNIVVGRYTIPGTYHYIAIYTNQCGTFTDTATVVASSTVPVQLVSLKAVKQADDIVLNWATASEKNNHYFEVQRSLDGTNFESIANVKGKGTTQVFSKYVFTDPQAALLFGYAGNVFYRLNQIDFDGTNELSKTVAVELNKTINNDFNILPNPNEGSFSISRELVSTAPETINVYNTLGALVYTETRLLQEGNNRIDLNLNLDKGVYILVIENSGVASAKRFIIK